MSALVSRRFLVAVFLGAATPNSDATAQADSAQLENRIIDEIRLIGVNYTKPFVVTRELASREGEPYTAAKARKDAERLDRLGIFSRIDVRGIEEQGRVVLEVDVLETTAFVPQISVRFTDEDGIQAGGGAATVNAMHRAMSGSAIVLVGGATNVELKGKDPWVTGNHLGLELQFFYRDRRNELFNFNEKSNELQFAVSTYLGERGRAGVRFAAMTIRSDSSGITLDPDNRDETVILGAYVGYDSRDLWSNPRSGWWNEVMLARGGVAGSDAGFWTLVVDVRRFIPIRRHSSILLTSLWSVTSGVLGEDVAVWQQAGVGGTNSVRGWPLGSRIGKNQTINTAELRLNLFEPRAFQFLGLRGSLGFQIALFGDVGHAWSSTGEFDLDNFIGGYGAGFRLLVPSVGMVRFDLALGEPGAGIRFHLGGFEKSVKQRDRVR